MSRTFIDQLDDVVEVVSDFGVQIVTRALDLLAPDGRPFGYEPGTPEMQIQEYMPLRGNAEAWGQWIMDNAQVIVEKMQENSLSPSDIESIHPYDIAQKAAIGYSVRMEALIKTHGKKFGLE